MCNRAGDCISRWVWIEASKAIFKRLDEITIGSLMSGKKKQIDEARQYRDKLKKNKK